MTDLEREYSPSSRVGGDAAPFIAEYESRSDVVRRAWGERVQRLPGGSLVLSAGDRAPALVFVHGGYWQALSASSSMQLAPAALRAGWTYAAVEYTLAPEADLPTMVDQCTTALREIRSAVGVGPLVVAGHSAGAHLAAMTILATPAPVDVARVVLVSGVYDLRPLVHTSVNTALRLDGPSATAMSPLLLPVRGSAAVTIAWGDDDTDAFKSQSAAFADHVRAGGLEVAAFECAGRHHFDIVDDLVDPATELGAFTLGGLG